jgi:hypothetical protein
MSNKELEKEYTGEPIADMSLGIKRRGMMKPGAYASDLQERGAETPEDVGTDEKILRIALGHGVKLFNNPQELATSLTGFESWCKEKNIVPSYAAIASYLGCSKSTVLKYMKDTTQYSIYILYDNIENKNIYTTTNKEYLDKYIERNSVVEIDSKDNEDKEESNKSKNKESKSISKGSTYSIRDKLDNGEYKIVCTSVSFAEVMGPVCTLIELITTNKAWTMRNPSWPIWLSKNKFGATEQFVDRTEQVVTATNPLDEMDDDQIIKAAQSLPDNL